MPMFVATAFLHNFQKAFEVQQAVKKFNSEFLIQLREGNKSFFIAFA